MSGIISGNRTHGLRSTYTDGCRCGPCTDANTAYSRDRRDGVIPPGGSHGLSGYGNYGCRCRVCTEAKQEANAAEYRGRQRCQGRAA